MAIEKIKILGAVLELPAKQHCQSSPFYLKTGPNLPNPRCCLAGSSQTAPGLFIFSIAMAADYLSYVKSIATFALTLYGYIILILASVNYLLAAHSSSDIV